MLNRRRDQAGRPCINQAVNMPIYAYAPTYLHMCVCVSVCVWSVQGVCIIALPKLEIYYNFHTSVTRGRRDTVDSQACCVYIYIYIIYIPLYVTIIFRVSQCHYFDRRRLRGSCSLRNVTSRRRTLVEAKGLCGYTDKKKGFIKAFSKLYLKFGQLISLKAVRF